MNEFKILLFAILALASVMRMYYIVNFFRLSDGKSKINVLEVIDEFPKVKFVLLYFYMVPVFSTKSENKYVDSFRKRHNYATYLLYCNLIGIMLFLLFNS